MNNVVRINILNGKFISYGNDFFKNSLPERNEKMIETSNGWLCYINKKDHLICEILKEKTENSKRILYTLRYTVTPTGHTYFTETYPDKKINKQGFTLMRHRKNKPLSGSLWLYDEIPNKTSWYAVFRDFGLWNALSKYFINDICYTNPNRIYPGVTFSSDRGRMMQEIWTDGTVSRYNNPNKDFINEFALPEDNPEDATFIVQKATWVVVDTYRLWYFNKDTHIPINYTPDDLKVRRIIRERILYVYNNIESFDHLRYMLKTKLTGTIYNPADIFNWYLTN